MRSLIYQVCPIFLVAALGGLSCLSAHAEATTEALILPGKSIGQIKLDAELPTVEKLLGKPTESEGAGGRAWDIWESSKGDAEQSYRTSVYAEHTTSEGKVQFIQSIRVTSPFFHTGEGINTQSSLEAIWKVFPMLRYYSTYQHEGKTIEVYADGTLGISFEIQRTAADTGSLTWGTCHAVCVYKGGADSMGPLVPKH